MSEEGGGAGSGRRVGQGGRRVGRGVAVGRGGVAAEPAAPDPTLWPPSRRRRIPRCGRQAGGAGSHLWPPSRRRRIPRCGRRAGGAGSHAVAAEPAAAARYSCQTPTGVARGALFEVLGHSSGASAVLCMSSRPRLSATEEARDSRTRAGTCAAADWPAPCYPGWQLARSAALAPRSAGSMPRWLATGQIRRGQPRATTRPRATTTGNRAGLSTRTEPGNAGLATPHGAGDRRTTGTGHAVPSDPGLRIGSAAAVPAGYSGNHSSGG